MFGNWILHSYYQTFLVDSLKTLHTKHDDKILEFQKGISKLYLLNLDPLKELITHLYSNTGRPSKQQDIILRSFILMNECKVTSTTIWWKNYLIKNPVIKAAVGLKPNEHVPSIGAHYDFISRIIPFNDSPRLKSVEKKPREKLKKNEKLPIKNPGVVDTLVNYLINHPVNSISNHKFNLLQQIFASIVVSNSAKNGFLGDTSNLDISSDGTCAATGASTYGKKVCKCRENGIYDCKCDRKFSDPNASWGWDSYNARYFYGYTAFFACVYNPYIKTDLPIYLRLFDAKRHDSTSSLVALSEILKLYPHFHINSYILDSASDNYSTYKLLNYLNINPIIALNKRNKTLKYDDGIYIDNTGTPVCKGNHKMIFWGNCKGRSRIKWRCPLVTKKIDKCKHCVSCSNSSYGRTFYTKPSDDIRLFTPIPRNSKEFKLKMNSRTACERVNNRILHNYNIEGSKLRGKARLSFFTFLAATNIHLDVWLKQFNFSILSLLNS
ncbi:MAG: hypothetical protein RRZ34_02100 [Malacoplasma sp.]